jgi:molybdate transport system ATP-binding protein
MGQQAVTLRAEIRVVRGTFALDLDLTAEAGEVVVLLGPNGAGKTTALRTLAGLTPPVEGRIELDGEVLDDVETGRRTPTEHRPIGFVFQDYRLFPHLTAVQNVEFGLRSKGVRKPEARTRAIRWLARVGLAGAEAMKPGALSGGQAQRVALARALASEPRLLLLDEPMAALDATTRSSLRSELRDHLAVYGGCTIVVTHDPLDAMVLADRLVVLEGGAVVQEGAPGHVARHPATQYVAQLVGLNLLTGQADGHDVALHGGGRLSVAEAASGEVLVAVRPDAVSLFRSRPDGSPRNVWAARVAGVEMHGDRVRVALDGPAPLLADITQSALADLGLVGGSDVWVAIKASETSVYPAH